MIDSLVTRSAPVPQRFEGSKPAALIVLVAVVAAPAVLSDTQLLVLSYAGVLAIGGIGLNLLIGYAGQLSLGHAFFMGVGGYLTGWLGASVGLPVLIWMPAAAVAGAAVGAVVGPLALRLAGIYLAIVTLGLVIAGQYLFEQWRAFTGGGNGRSVLGAFPALDTADVGIAGQTFSRESVMYLFVLLMLGLGLWASHNIVRSRVGRALQAIRDKDMAAEVLGVDVTRYKIAAFAISGSYAAVAGAIFGVLQVRVQPTDFGLGISIQYVAVIIVGGIATVHGPLLGALLIASFPRAIEALTRSYDIPFVSGDRGGMAGFIEVASLNTILYGAVIIATLIIEPRGLAALVQRLPGRAGGRTKER